MDAKTKQLLTDADSYLSLLWHRYIPNMHKHGSLKLEVESVMNRWREAKNDSRNTLEVQTR